MNSNKLDCYPIGSIITTVFENDYFEKVGQGIYKKLENLENGSLKLTDEDIKIDDKKEYIVVWIG